MLIRDCKYLNRIVFILLLAAGGLFLCSYAGINLFRYTVQMDSDVAAEGLTARAMWLHGTAIPKEFYGSTETRIFSVNLLAAWIYGCTGNMNLSMGIACIVMMVTLIGLYTLLLRRLRFEWVSVAAMVLFLLAAPVTLRHAQLLYVQAVYYCIHSILMLLTLIMWMQVMHEGHESRRWIWRTLVSGVIAFVISLSGLRTALICYVPLVVTEMLRRLVMVVMHRGGAIGLPADVSAAARTDASTWYRSSLYVFVTFVFAFLGTRMPTSISMGTTRNIRHGFSKLLGEVLPDTLECINLGGVRTRCATAS